MQLRSLGPGVALPKLVLVGCRDFFKPLSRWRMLQYRESFPPRSFARGMQRTQKSLDLVQSTEETVMPRRFLFHTCSGRAGEGLSCGTGPWLWTLHSPRSVQDFTEGKSLKEGSLPPPLFHPSPLAPACSEMSLNQAVPAEAGGRSERLFGRQAERRRQERSRSCYQLTSGCSAELWCRRS